MKKIIVVFLLCILLVGCTDTSSDSFVTSVVTEAKKLTWDMYDFQVREIQNIPEENQTIDSNKWSWINYDGQEIFGCTGKLTYNFVNSKLTSIDFIPNQISDIDEMNKIYNTLKENVTLEYGDSNVDEFRESNIGNSQYHYTEWNTENTLIILQDNEKELHISLGFHSSENLKKYEESQTTTEAPIDEKTKIERKVYAYVTEYMDTTVNRVTINDNYGSEADGDYIVLVYLTWDVKNSGKTSKEMLDLYSSDMAAKMYDDLPSVQELCIFWTVPYLNDGQAKISFERNSSGMVYMDTVFDSNFD